MDRVLVYDGALPQTTDVLNAGKFALVGQAFQNQALLGSSTVIAGLGCTPTSPTASLQVVVGAGSIYQQDETDAAAYADLGTDTSVIMKQGILKTPATLTITPPTTSGYSQVYLVQAILSDVDGGLMVLSYYDSADEENPFSGPAGSGSSNYTTRTCTCAIALKAGAPAATGSQTAPTPDAGYIGLYTITVSNGQTQITSGNIAQLPSAPFFPTLPQVPYQVQQGTYIYGGQDSGTANNYVVTFVAGQPIPAALTAGLTVKFKALNACSGASVVNVNGLGNVAIRRATGVALTTGDIVSGQIVELTYDGTVFQMANYLGSGATSNTSTVVGIPYVADTGAQNAVVATYSPAITSGQQVAGLFIAVKLAYTITGACTINVSGLGAKSLTTGDLQNPPNAVYVAGETLLLVYDGTQYQIVNSSSLVYRKPSTNTTIYVNTATGSDTACDGTSASVAGGSSTAGPFKTIGRAVTAAWSYAPSQYTITIQVAAGTYSESVSTPSFAGPNVVINGASAASVFVSSGAGTCFSVSGPNTLTVQNLTVQNNGVYPLGGFSASSGASLSTSNTASNTCGIVWDSQAGATITPGNHTFNGSGFCAAYALYGAFLSFNACTLTFSTPISLSGGFAVVGYCATIGSPVSGPATFVNPSYVSGQRFNASVNGTIETNGLGLNFFPGTVAGATSTGGQVVS